MASPDFHPGPLLAWDQWPNRDYDFSAGRVLILDYNLEAPEVAPDGSNHDLVRELVVKAAEYNSPSRLRQDYSPSTAHGGNVLRVVHVQNAPWANDFLLETFNLHHNDGRSGADFSRWAEVAVAPARGNHQILKGKVFPAKLELDRGVIKGGFGFDHLKAMPLSREFRHSNYASSLRTASSASKPMKEDIGAIPKSSAGHSSSGSAGSSTSSGAYPPLNKVSVDKYKLMQLNNYDDNSHPVPSSEIFVQRLSVYIQYQDDNNPAWKEFLTDSVGWRQRRARHNSQLNPGMDADETGHQLGPPHDRRGGGDARAPREDRREETEKNDQVSIFSNSHKMFLSNQRSRFDNGNVIVIIDDSPVGSLYETLVPCRGRIETTWHLLPLHLPPYVMHSTKLDLEIMDIIINDLFRALEIGWERLLDKCDNHLSVLQNELYTNPADESRSTELWRNSKCWMVTNRLAVIHQTMIPQIAALLRAVTHSRPPNGLWLRELGSSFARIPSMVQEVLVKPTDGLNDLMHKSVQIRDARHSIRLGASMWRLSWITFVFLPLMFTAGFFDMASDMIPSGTIIKWFFVTSIPFMAVVIISWYVLKHVLSPERHPISYRQTYQKIYDNLADEYPQLWSNKGAANIIPSSMMDRLRWSFVKIWFNSSRTIDLPMYDPTKPTLGLMSRLRLFLAEQWTANLVKKQRSQKGGAFTQYVASTSQEGLGSELCGSDIEVGWRPQLSRRGRHFLTYLGLRRRRMERPGSDYKDTEIDIPEIETDVSYNGRIHISTPSEDGEPPEAAEKSPSVPDPIDLDKLSPRLSPPVPTSGNDLGISPNPFNRTASNQSRVTVPTIITETESASKKISNSLPLKIPKFNPSSQSEPMMGSVSGSPADQKTLPSQRVLTEPVKLSGPRHTPLINRQRIYEGEDPTEVLETSRVPVSNFVPTALTRRYNRSRGRRVYSGASYNADRPPTPEYSPHHYRHDSSEWVKGHSRGDSGSSGPSGHIYSMRGADKGKTARADSPSPSFQPSRRGGLSRTSAHHSPLQDVGVYSDEDVSDIDIGNSRTTRKGNRGFLGAIRYPFTRSRRRSNSSSRPDSPKQPSRWLASLASASESMGTKESPSQRAFSRADVDKIPEHPESGEDTAEQGAEISKSPNPE